MKLSTMTETSVLIVLFITVGLCFGQRTAKQNLFEVVEHDDKTKFEDVKRKFERSLDEVAIETTNTGERLRSFGNFISQRDYTGLLADSDDPEDDFDKYLNEMMKQFEKFSEDLKRIPESDEFKRFKKEMELLQEELKRDGQSTKEKIEKEIIPQLKKEMEKLKERFLKPRKRETEEPIGI